jgi:AcrR family transcriptional regulator
MTESLLAVTNSSQLGRQRILDATMHCLCEQGYDATTIRRIAGRLDCAVGSIYRYFADKHALLLAVTERLFEPVVEALDAGATFAQSVELYAQLALQDAQAYRLMFWLSSNGSAGKTHATAETTSPPSSPGSALPQVVATVVDGWARHLADRQRALQCWAIAHGSIIAGLDLQAVCQSVCNLAAGQAMDHEGNAMAQIVTLLRDPPHRAEHRQPQPPPPEALAASPEAIEQLIAPTLAPQSIAPVEDDDDDVCLL